MEPDTCPPEDHTHQQPRPHPLPAAPDGVVPSSVYPDLFWQAPPPLVGPHPPSFTVCLTFSWHKKSCIIKKFFDQLLWYVRLLNQVVSIFAGAGEVHLMFWLLWRDTWIGFLFLLLLPPLRLLFQPHNCRHFVISSLFSFPTSVGLALTYAAERLSYTFKKFLVCRSEC